MRGADPAIVLVPGVGMFSFGADKQTARVAGEFYLNAINVMRGAEAISAYAPIAESEKFRIEYWELEEAKLRRRPKPKPLAGRVALVTGGRLGHRPGHRAAAGRRGGLRGRRRPGRRGGQDRRGQYRLGRRRPSRSSPTSPARTTWPRPLAAAALAFGGVDLVVNNAGLSISKPLTETTLADWDILHDVMARGSFLVSREAAKVMAGPGHGRRHHLHRLARTASSPGRPTSPTAPPRPTRPTRSGCSPPSSAPSASASTASTPTAWSAARGIFAGGWGAKRAAVYGVPEDELGAYYAQRTLLKKEVLPEHIAAAVFALAGGDLPLTTGLLIPVDAGVAAAFLR